MKVGIASDVHANWPALEAVLEEMKGNVDCYIYLGDIVGLMGFPHECVSAIMSQFDYVVKGNHDVSVIERGLGHVNSRELSNFEYNTTVSALSEEQMDWIRSLDSYMEIPEHGILMSHAYPTPEMATGIESGNRGLTKGNYLECASSIDSDTFDFIFVGHTHNQATLNCSKFAGNHNVTIVNPGTVGQAGEGIAEYAIVDTDSSEVDLCSTDYDWSRVEKRLEELEVPIRWWK